MPFRDSQEGQTHYENDGCGEPKHNTPKNPWEEEFEVLYSNALGIIGKNIIKDFIRTEIEKARKEERDSWINQPANQHDGKIRKAERERIRGIVERKKMPTCDALPGGFCTCPTGKFVINDVLQDILDKLK